MFCQSNKNRAYIFASLANQLGQASKIFTNLTIIRYHRLGLSGSLIRTLCSVSERDLRLSMCFRVGALDKDKYSRYIYIYNYKKNKKIRICMSSVIVIFILPNRNTLVRELTIILFKHTVSTRLRPRRLKGVHIARRQS